MRAYKTASDKIQFMTNYGSRKGARTVITALVCLVVGGCTSISSDLPTGPEAYAVVPHTMPQTERYVLDSSDTVTVSVFREPELSVVDRVVDAGGNLNLPLIGNINVRGKTTGELSDDIRSRLTRYVIDPKVSVGVVSASQSVAVEGSVNQPGIYPIPGRSSLLETMALARSPTRIAALDQIFVFRTIDGQEHAARFDLRRIRAGLDPDPVILPSDKIVVGYSNLKELWLEYLSIPVFNIFRTF